MERWEYRVSRNVDELAELGRQGWELVSVIALGENGQELYFKRPFPLKKEITLAQRDRLRQV